MKVPFSKWSPGGNITVLLEQVLPEEKHSELCTQVLSSQHLQAEQSGTIDLNASPPCLRMMGDEFCINATRSCAALLVEKEMLPFCKEAQLYQGAIFISCFERSVSVSAKKISDALFESYLHLQFDKKPDIISGDGYHIIYLDGITHLLLNTAIYPLPSLQQETLIHKAQLWRRRLNLEQAPAVGVIWVDYDQVQQGRIRITPVVWVRDTGTAYAETACGSGSLAASFVQFCNAACSADRWHVQQPSGDDLVVFFDSSSDTLKIKIGGTVRLIARGVAYL